MAERKVHIIRENYNQFFTIHCRPNRPIIWEENRTKAEHGPWMSTCPRCLDAYNNPPEAS